MKFWTVMLLFGMFAMYTNAFTLSLRRVKKEETNRLFNIKFYKELLNFSQNSMQERGGLFIEIYELTKNRF